MERGQPSQTVYTFEAGPGVTMDYPAEELWTRDYQEARRYAQEHGYRVIGNEYEFEDSGLIDDFTPETECGSCGLVIEKQDTGIWEDPLYPPDQADARRYCDAAPDHRHRPAVPGNPG